MKVLLAITVLLAVHCTLSHATLLDSLKELLEEKQKEAAVEKELEAKKREQDEKKELVKKILEKLASQKDKKGWFSDVWDSVSSTVGDGATNLFESVQDTFNGDSQENQGASSSFNEDDLEDIELPDDLLTSGSTDPCEKAVLLQESSSGVIKFPKSGDYPNFENCRWVLNASASNKQIKIKITSMDIRENGNCDDYLKIYQMTCRPQNGDDYKGIDITGKLCGEDKTSISKKYDLQSSCAMIYFRSNWIYKAKGFTLEYEFKN